MLEQLKKGLSKIGEDLLMGNIIPRLLTKTTNCNCELQNNCILFIHFFFCSDLPDKPSSVTISVASEDSLLVRFIEPLNEKVVVSKYKSEYKKLISNCIFLKN